MAWFSRWHIVVHDSYSEIGVSERILSHRKMLQIIPTDRFFDSSPTKAKGESGFGRRERGQNHGWFIAAPESSNPEMWSPMNKQKRQIHDAVSILDDRTS